MSEILSENSPKKVGHVALIGRPNSGKSTFINTLLEEKVSIISSKPQTTQKVIRGIYNDLDSQIVFFDTPGLNEGNDDFQASLKKGILDSLKKADVIIRFIDSSRPYGQEEEIIKNLLDTIIKPIITVYSKGDISKIQKEDNILTISSITKSGMKDLLVQIKKLLPTGQNFYPDDYYTDQDIYTRISEIIREKIFVLFKEEIPYSTFVEIGEINDEKNILKILAYIYVESDSQKRIVIGKGGQNLTIIGSQAREDLKSIFNKKIYLNLRIKTLPKWKKNRKIIDKLFK